MVASRRRRLIGLTLTGIVSVGLVGMIAIDQVTERPSSALPDLIRAAATAGEYPDTPFELSYEVRYVGEDGPVAERYVWTAESLLAWRLEQTCCEGATGTRWELWPDGSYWEIPPTGEKLLLMKLPADNGLSPNGKFSPRYSAQPERLAAAGIEVQSSHLPTVARLGLPSNDLLTYTLPELDGLTEVRTVYEPMNLLLGATETAADRVVWELEALSFRLLPAATNLFPGLSRPPRPPTLPTGPADLQPGTDVPPTTTL